MSDNNQNKIPAASYIKYAIIGALLLLAPIALVNQILMPMLSA